MLINRVAITQGLFDWTGTWLPMILLLFFLSLIGSGQAPVSGNPVLHECWRYKTTDLEPTTAASDGTSVYIAERGGKVTAVSAVDGKRIWSTELGGDLSSNLVVVNREIQVVTNSGAESNELRSLSSVSGIANRSIPLANTGTVRLISIGNRVLVASATGGLSAVDPAVDKVIWTKSFGSTPKVLTTAGSEVVAGFADRQIAFIDSHEGKTTRKLETKFVPSALLLGGDYLLIGDERGNITNLDLSKNRRVWTLKSGGKISGIYSVDDSSLLVTSFDNFTYLVDRRTGHVIWKRRQSSRVVDTAIISTRYAGVTPSGESTVVLIDPSTGKSLGQIIIPSTLEFVQGAQLMGQSIVIFTTEGLISFAAFGCKNGEKAEAGASAFK